MNLDSRRSSCEERTQVVAGQFSIRLAGTSDLDTVYWMGKPVFQSSTKYDWGWSRKFLHSLLGPSFGFIQVAILRGSIVGFHCGVWRYPDSSKTQCRMVWLYVLPSFRRRGVATKLLRASLKLALNRRKRSVCIGVWSTDVAARDLITDAGFAPVAVWTVYKRHL